MVGPGCRQPIGFGHSTAPKYQYELSKSLLTRFEIVNINLLVFASVKI